MRALFILSAHFSTPFPLSSPNLVRLYIPRVKKDNSVFPVPFQINYSY
jgi:hypothetical protein